MPRELIPIILFQVLGLVALAFSPVGKAIARRISGGRVDENEAAELRGEIAELREQLADVEARLAGDVDELHNRLDFTERVAAQLGKGALPREP